jgi:DNA-binding CsgD family transcriptional regulator
VDIVLLRTYGQGGSLDADSVYEQQHDLAAQVAALACRELRSELASRCLCRTGGAHVCLLLFVDVLRLVARGLSNREIGTTLFISEHTAANYVRSILRKTACANRTEATAYAYRRGLVES